MYVCAPLQYPPDHSGKQQAAQETEKFPDFAYVAKSSVSRQQISERAEFSGMDGRQLRRARM